MWPWRRRPPSKDLRLLPRRCFISHSYRDVEARGRLLAQLPQGVEPFVFPPIVVPPEQLVSSELLNAIRSCDGLIYLRKGASEQSFWVAFERDYALRLGKPVFAFDPEGMELTREQSTALELSVFISYYQGEREQARHVVATLRQRYINAWFDVDELGLEIIPEYPAQMAQRGILHALETGGYVVVLWSSLSSKSNYIRYELEKSEHYRHNRVLFAVLDQESLAVPFREDNRLVVQLFADDERSFVQRIDDLIVRLYWLIYRNTRQNRLE